MGSLLCTHVWLYHVLWHCHIAPEFICPPCLIPGCLLCTFMNLSSIGHLLPEKPSFVAAEDLLWMVSSLLNQLLQLCWKCGSSFFIGRLSNLYIFQCKPIPESAYTSFTFSKWVSVTGFRGSLAGVFT